MEPSPGETSAITWLSGRLEESGRHKMKERRRPRRRGGWNVLGRTRFGRAPPGQRGGATSADRDCRRRGHRRDIAHAGCNGPCIQHHKTILRPGRSFMGEERWKCGPFSEVFLDIADGLHGMSSGQREWRGKHGGEPSWRAFLPAERKGGGRKTWWSERALRAARRRRGNGSLGELAPPSGRPNMGDTRTGE